MSKYFIAIKAFVTSKGKCNRDSICQAFRRLQANATEERIALSELRAGEQQTLVAREHGAEALAMVLQGFFRHRDRG